MAEHKYKVGEYVRIVKGAGETHEYNNGDIGRVLDAWLVGGTLTVQVGNQTSQLLLPSEIEPVLHQDTSASRASAQPLREWEEANRERVAELRATPLGSRGAESPSKASEPETQGAGTLEQRRAFWDALKDAQGARSGSDAEIDALWRAVSEACVVLDVYSDLPRP